MYMREKNYKKTVYNSVCPIIFHITCYVLRNGNYIFIYRQIATVTEKQSGYLIDFQDRLCFSV